MKHRSIVAASAVAALCLSACGGDDETADTTEAPATTVAETVPETSTATTVPATTEPAATTVAPTTEPPATTAPASTTTTTLPALSDEFLAWAGGNSELFTTFATQLGDFSDIALDYLGQLENAPGAADLLESSNAVLDSLPADTSDIDLIVVRDMAQAASDGLSAAFAGDNSTALGALTAAQTLGPDFEQVVFRLAAAPAPTPALSSEFTDWLGANGELFAEFASTVSAFSGEAVNYIGNFDQTPGAEDALRLSEQVLAEMPAGADAAEFVTIASVAEPVRDGLTAAFSGDQSTAMSQLLNAQSVSTEFGELVALVEAMPEG